MFSRSSRFGPADPAYPTQFPLLGPDPSPEATGAEIAIDMESLMPHIGTNACGTQVDAEQLRDGVTALARARWQGAITRTLSAMHPTPANRFLATVAHARAEHLNTRAMKQPHWFSGIDRHGGAFPEIAGTLKIHDGALGSDHPVLKAILDLLNADDEFKRLAGQHADLDGKKITLSMPQSMTECHDALEKYWSPEQDGEEGTGGTLIPTLMRLRDSGAVAVKEDEVVLSRHPYELLANQVPEINIESHTQFANEIHNALGQHPDFCARMAAAFALHKATRTQFAIVPMLMSIGLSGVAGYLLEMVAGDAALKSLFAEKLRERGFTGFDESILDEANSLEKFLTVLNRTYPTLPIEGLDTLIVLTAMDIINGDKPALRDVVRRIPTALMAGGISLVGSLPDKAVELMTSKTGKLLLSIPTSWLSVLSCASGIFLEMGEQTHTLRDRLRQAHEDGHMVYPTDIDPADTHATEAYITDLAEQTLNIAPGSKIGRQSIPIALGIATIAALAGVGIPVTVMNILKLVVFNPVEVLALNFSVTLDRLAGDGAFHRDLISISEQTQCREISPLSSRNDTLAKFGGAVITGAYDGAASLAGAVKHTSSWLSLNNKRTRAPTASGYDQTYPGEDQTRLEEIV